MKLIIEHTDLEVLYYALGCLSPMNEAHKPLAILLARLEVQRERYFIPLNDDSWPAYSATPRHGTSRVGDDWLTRSVWHQRNGTACSHGIDPAD